MCTWTVHPSTTKELSALYQVSTKVFRSHIKPFLNEIGERHGNYFTVKQIEIIIDKLGLPPDVEIVYSSIRKAS